MSSGFPFIGRAAFDKSPVGIGWPDPVDGPWFIRGYWIDRDGRPELVGIDIWRGVWPPVADQRKVYRAPTNHRLEPGGFSAANFAELRFGDIRQRLLEHEAEHDQWLKGWLPKTAREQLDVPDSQIELIDYWASLPTSFKKGSRITRDHLRQVADVYLHHAWVLKKPPRAAVKGTFNVSLKTVDLWIAKCLVEGLLVRSGRGKPHLPPAGHQYAEGASPQPAKKGRK